MMLARSLLWSCLAVLCTLSGCGRDSSPPSGSPASEGAADRAAIVLPGELAGADLERGALLGLACRPCHTFGAGESDMLGPNLYGVFGRTAGTKRGFAYSPAMRGSEIVWTPRTMQEWLARPAQVIPGNSMAFAGLSSESDRRDLVAYLLIETGGPAAASE